MHQSIATIDSPEFINLQPLDKNPLMSSCEIKVLYIGENRNHSYISKEVATEMAKTLRGAPIVGYYKKENDDFADHGQRMIIDDEGIKFECLTKPYGFVAPDAKVWFQKFDDKDDFGNIETREYLMTTGYLWTEQFEECKDVIQKGKPQSMELDDKTLEGHWSTNSKTGVDFLIIDDAIFSKLCILGDDVEPCFEGANITKPEVSNTFTKVDDSFKRTLYTMMQELRFALEGGEQMDIENPETTTKEVSTAAAVEEETTATENTEIQEKETVETENVEKNEAEEDKSEQSTSQENEDSIETPSEDNENSFTKTEDNKEKEESVKEEEKEDKTKKTCGNDKKKTKHTIEQEYEELKTQFSQLKEDYNKLVEFKRQIEDEKKDELIKSFYMLSDEDKSDVIKNKSEYTLEEIESKLSVICFRNKVSFSDFKENENNNNENVVTTFTLDDDTETAPEWILAVRKVKEERNK